MGVLDGSGQGGGCWCCPGCPHRNICVGVLCAQWGSVQCAVCCMAASVPVPGQGPRGARVLPVRHRCVRHRCVVG